MKYLILYILSIGLKVIRNIVETRQKGLQINSGPMRAFVFILLALRRSNSKLVEEITLELQW